MEHFSIVGVLVVLGILGMLSFILSASETSIIALSKLRLRHMVAQKVPGAARVQRLVLNLDKFIATILIGNNFVNIAISAITTVIFVRYFGPTWGMVISTVVTTFCVLVFCEITPKIIATKITEKTAIFAALIMESVIRILAPLTYIFMGISSVILRILRLDATKRSPLVTEEELRMMIEVGREEGVLSDEERKMLHRIFEFGDIRLGDIMVPKDKIIAIDIKATAEQLLDVFVEQGHARLPVYNSSIDNILGIIYARDLLYILRDQGLFVIADLVHKAFYAPQGMRVNELLRKFQADKIQIAIVVDEHQKTVGVVTLEDLVEEIVGEIGEEKTLTRGKG